MNLHRNDLGWRGPLIDLPSTGGARLHACAQISVDDSGHITGIVDEIDAGNTNASPGDSIEILVPGFCNPHVHLELTGFLDKIEPTSSFPEWADQLFALKGELGAEQMSAGVAQGLESSLRAGVTALADTVSIPQVARAHAEAASPIRRILYLEALGINAAMTIERMETFRQLHQEAREARDWVAHNRNFEDKGAENKAPGDEGESTATPRQRGELHLGLSPHAPHTICDALSDSLKAAWEGESIFSRDCVSIHAAETPAEFEFLEHGRGEFFDFFQRLGFLPDDWTPPGEGAIQRLERLGWLPRCAPEYESAGLLERVSNQAEPLRPRTILAHGNYLTPEDIALLIRRRVAVCWCPETHAYFGHSDYPLEQNRAAPLVLGSDSMASAWSLAPLDQLRRALTAKPAWDAADALAAISLCARDAAFGRQAGPPDADFTVLEIDAKYLETAAEDAAAAMLREMLLDPATRVSRAIIGGKAGGGSNR